MTLRSTEGSVFRATARFPAPAVSHMLSKEQGRRPQTGQHGRLPRSPGGRAIARVALGAFSVLCGSVILMASGGLSGCVNPYFPDVSFPALICHLYLFFGGVSLKVFGPFLIFLLLMGVTLFNRRRKIIVFRKRPPHRWQGYEDNALLYDGLWPLFIFHMEKQSITALLNAEMYFIASTWPLTSQSQLWVG